jgi:hypothetical protein
MLRRMGEMRRAAEFRDEHEVPMGSPEAWARVLAEICLYLPRGWLDLLTFRRIAPPDVPISDDDAIEALHALERIAKRRGGEYRPMSAKTVGRLLEVTAKERWACDIRTMEAIDETPEERRADREQRKRQRDLKRRQDADERARERERERSRLAKQRKRRAQGARPHAQSLSRTRPWKAQGISRRTWERRRAAKASRPSVTQIRPALHMSSLLKEGAGRNCVKRRSRRGSLQIRWVTFAPVVMLTNLSKEAGCAVWAEAGLSQASTSASVRAHRNGGPIHGH